MIGGSTIGMVFGFDFGGIPTIGGRTIGMVFCFDFGGSGFWGDVPYATPIKTI